jgi:Ca2+-binding EF-hand superfamily protein
MNLFAKRGFVLALLVGLLPLRAAQAQSEIDARRDLVAAHFLEADADGDGELTREEFTQLIDLNAGHDIGRARLIARLDRYDLAFGRADENADGSVTREELAALATQGR